VSSRLARFDVAAIRADFPILRDLVHGKPLVYLDSANTSQKPESVMRAMDDYYRHANANIHRATHLLSERATQLYEGTRIKAARFINAPGHRSVVFTTGTTDGINLVAQTYGRARLKPDDEVLVSWLEHHSNIVPWQILCEQTGATLRVAAIDDAGEIDLESFAQLVSPRTRIVALSHVSNALGTVNPVKEMIATAHKFGVPVCVDAAQSVPHFPVDVQDLDADFFVFSGHKMFAPTGSGAVYGKREWLDKMPPYQTGGSQIRTVSFEKTTYAPLPAKFEAGTPAIAAGIGLGAAIDYLNAIDFEAAAKYEHELLEYATARLADIPGVTTVGTAAEKASVLSFTIENVHPHDIGTILDQQGIAVRAGHHCAQPVMQFFDVPATARASFAFYNTREEVDKLADAVQKVIEVFA
jgi:cysteine desulfurase/selenocysteine lyase